MKNKDQVYVEVRTGKQAKKLNKVLDMFREKHTPRCFHGYIKGSERVHFKPCSNQFWNDNGWSSGCKTQVTIKELKNILAKEHLKEGFVLGCAGAVDTTLFYPHGKVNKFYKIKGYSLFNTHFQINTDEGGITIYKDGKWAEIIVNEQVVKENIKNLKQDIKGSKLDHIERKVVEYAESVEWDFEKVHYFIGGGKNNLIFEDYNMLQGDWTNDKTENIFNKYNPHWELKQAYKDGTEIEFYDFFSDKWRSIANPLWHKNDKYRIRPLQVGDWVMYYSGEIQKYTIITQGNLNHYTKNKCTRVKDKQLIDLLNNNK